MTSVLFLAPQPFFIERGTPIAVKMMLNVLIENFKDQSLTIDLLTYHEGTAAPIQNVTHHRICNVPFVKNIGPGLSLKKIICDLFFACSAIKLTFQKRDQFSLIHAVEESVFIALLLKFLFKIPYVYDMDSSLAEQITEKYRSSSFLLPIFKFLERTAIRNALAVVPVCDYLAEVALNDGQRSVHTLHDVSFLPEVIQTPRVSDVYLDEANIPLESAKIVYIGNLEPYQGIDLLLHAFALVYKTNSSAHLVVIGGTKDRLEYYTEIANTLGINSRVHFLGPRPLELLELYIRAATILVSPRLKGNNTPMKLYSYLHSGIPVVATKLKTHTQIITNQEALLTELTAESFAEGISTLLNSKTLRDQIGAKARALAEQNFTTTAFSKKLKSAYSELLRKIDTTALD